MVSLIIKEPDGSIYWTDYFVSVSEANEWLKIEQSRPYWVAERTAEIIDNSAEEQARKEAAERAASERATAVARASEAIRTARSRRNRTLAEVNDLLDQIINYLGI